MKKLVLGTIVTGATIFTLVGLFVAACGSTPPVGAGGTTGGGGGVGGVVINTTTSTGTAGSTSGGGSTGATPTTDVNCGTQTSGTSQEPADVLLVLDRSGSMDESISEECYCDPAKVQRGGTGPQACPNASECKTRWVTVTSAVNTTIASTTAIHWGLKFFSTSGGSGPNSSGCNVSTAVEVAVGAANAATAIQTQIAATSPGNNTPTAAAITAATTYLKTVTDQNNKVILLATDGEPNCKAGGKNTDSDVPGTVTAIGAALAAGFKVYVIGIGPSVGNLDSFAQAGGTTKSFPATSPQDLAAALASISKAVTTCTFALAKTPPDVNNISVYLDKNLLQKDPANGWSLGANSQTVVLNGTSCEKVTSGEATQVQVLFGCPGVAPPLIIP